MKSILFIDILSEFNHISGVRRAWLKRPVAHYRFGECVMTRTLSFHLATFTLASLVVAAAFAPLLQTAAAIIG